MTTGFCECHSGLKLPRNTTLKGTTGFDSRGSRSAVECSGHSATSPSPSTHTGVRPRLESGNPEKKTGWSWDNMFHTLIDVTRRVEEYVLDFEEHCMLRKLPEGLWYIFLIRSLPQAVLGDMRSALDFDMLEYVDYPDLIDTLHMLYAGSASIPMDRRGVCPDEERTEKSGVCPLAERTEQSGVCPDGEMDEQTGVCSDEEFLDRQDGGLNSQTGVCPVAESEMLYGTEEFIISHINNCESFSIAPYSLHHANITDVISSETSVITTCVQIFDSTDIFYTVRDEIYGFMVNPLYSMPTCEFLRDFFSDDEYSERRIFWRCIVQILFDERVHIFVSMWAFGSLDKPPPNVLKIVCESDF